MESLLLDSRVSFSRLSMAQQFSLCKIMADSRPLSRIVFCWPEGHGLGTSEGDGGCFVSQESSCEINGDMNFTSLNMSRLGHCFAIGLSGQGIEVVEAVVPNFSSRLPWEGFS